MIFISGFDLILKAEGRSYSSRMTDHSFVIPAYNEEKYIEETLKAVESQKVDKEIILVDGGSNDATLEIAERFDCQIITGIEGRGNARDVGAKQSVGEYLYFIDADTVVEEGYAKKLREFIEDNGLIAASSKFEMTGYRSKVVEVFGNQLFNRVDPVLLPGFNIAVKRQDYLESDGFKDVFGEDYQFSKAISKQGKTAILDEELVKTSGRRITKYGLTGTLIYYSGKNVLRKIEMEESSVFKRHKTLKRIDAG